MEKINCRELVEELLEDFGFYNEGARDIDFRVDIAAGHYLISDRQRLKIILNNLISNAIKYHDPGKDERYIEVALRSNAGSSLLSVRDNGQGVKEEHQKHLFEMFYTANLRAEGSGIGLYILKEAVDQLKGTVSLHSEEGQGTEFQINLPKL